MSRRTAPRTHAEPGVLPRWVHRADRRLSGRLNEWASSAHLDSTLLRISNSANHGGLWFVAAAGLALTGPRGRSAAVRGLLSLGLASGVANLVAKPIFGGPRPLLAEVPATRRLAQSPRSSSFPSGHTASAVGFATGVLLETPGMGLLLAPLAAAVGYSRLHVGAHWVSDVAGGALIGGVLAVAGRKFVPVILPVMTPR